MVHPRSSTIDLRKRSRAICTPRDGPPAIHRPTCESEVGPADTRTVRDGFIPSGLGVGPNLGRRFRSDGSGEEEGGRFRGCEGVGRRASVCARCSRTPRELSTGRRAVECERPSHADTKTLPPPERSGPTRKPLTRTPRGPHANATRTQTQTPRRPPRGPPPAPTETAQKRTGLRTPGEIRRRRGRANRPA
jgi:hypothetical protein